MDKIKKPARRRFKVHCRCGTVNPFSQDSKRFRRSFFLFVFDWQANRHEDSWCLRKNNQSTPDLSWPTQKPTHIFTRHSLGQRTQVASHLIEFEGGSFRGWIGAGHFVEHKNDTLQEYEKYLYWCNEPVFQPCEQRYCKDEPDKDSPGNGMNCLDISKFG